MQSCHSSTLKSENYVVPQFKQLSIGLFSTAVDSLGDPQFFSVGVFCWDMFHQHDVEQNVNGVYVGVSFGQVCFMKVVFLSYYPQHKKTPTNTLWNTFLVYTELCFMVILLIQDIFKFFESSHE